MTARENTCQTTSESRLTCDCHVTRCGCLVFVRFLRYLFWYYLQTRKLEAVLKPKARLGSVYLMNMVFVCSLPLFEVVEVGHQILVNSITLVLFWLIIFVIVLLVTVSFWGVNIWV